MTALDLMPAPRKQAVMNLGALSFSLFPRADVIHSSEPRASPIVVELRLEIEASDGSRNVQPAEMIERTIESPRKSWGSVLAELFELDRQ